MADRRHPLTLAAACALALLASGCFASAGIGPNANAPLEVVADVDLERFMGKWYVVESVGTSAEANAYDAVEIYTLDGPGEIDIDFLFHEGNFDGPIESIAQRGWVPDPNAPGAWRVRPFWPLSLAYLIIDLAPDYRYTVIGHPSKRWVWIMSRTPTLAERDLVAIRARLVDAGYDLGAMRRVPQRPLAERGEL